MKKLIMILLSVFMLTLATSCVALTTIEATGVAISKNTNTYFVLNEDEVNENLRIDILYTTSTIPNIPITIKSEGDVYTVNSTVSLWSNISIENFFINELGSRTATLSVTIANAVFTVDFDYHVAEFKGAGTEELPYVIDSLDKFNIFRDPSKPYATGGYYWDVTCDIDTAELALEETYAGPTSAVSSWWFYQSVVQHFVGNLDFNNHKITTNENALALFYSAGNAKIQNLNYHLNIAMPILFSPTNGNVVLENINTYGTVQTADNNFTPFVIYYYPTEKVDLIYNNCTNYANVTSTASGCSGLFLGSGANKSALSTCTVTFNNCENYGTLLASKASASMLISNISLIGAGMNYENIFISDCVNYGTIFGNAQQSNLAIGRSSGFGVNATIYAYLNDNTKIWNAERAKCENNANAFGVLTIQNGNFVLPTVDNAVRYELTFSFWDFMYNDPQKTDVHSWGSVGKTINLTSLENVVVPAYSWRTNYHGKTLTEVTIGQTTLYSFAESGSTYYAFKGISDDTKYHTLRASNLPNALVLTAYDDNGNVLSMSQHIYPD